MLNETSLAAGVGASVKNVQFAPDAQNLPRKILVVGTYLSTVTDLPANAAQLVLSPEDAGYRAGFGSMLHRLVSAAFLGGQGTPVYMLPQA
jgi:phage tail sheath gpL-like